MGALLSWLRWQLAHLRTRERFYFEGLRLSVRGGVVNPSRFEASTYFARAAASLAPPRPARVLELGCGCGLTALLLARYGHQVVALDVDPQAVANTVENVDDNDLCLTVLLSDWDAGLGEARFDYVVCNPPFMPGAPREYTRAFHAGERLEILRGACGAMRRRIAEGGRGLLFTSSLSGRGAVLELLRLEGLEVLETKAKRCWNEVYFADLVAPSRDG